MEPPDTEEKMIRFGCGFVAGLLLAGSSGLIFALAGGAYLLAACIALGTLCGLAALRLGDRFWERLRDFGPWW